MLLYGIIVVITTAIAYVYSHTKGYSHKFFWCLLVAFPTVFSALRGCGTDYIQHKINYDRIISGNYIYANYNSIVIKLMRYLGGNGYTYQLTIAIVSAITIFVAFYIFKIYEEDISFTIAVFSFMSLYYLLSFNLYRQCLAIVLFLIAVTYKAKYNSNVKFWVIGIISGLIHSASFLFLSLFFIWGLVTKKKYKYSRLVFYTISICVIILIPIVAEKLSYLGTVFTHYEYYFSHFVSFKVGLGLIRYLILAIWPAICMSKIISSGTPMVKGFDYIPFFAIFGTIIWLTSYISDSFMYRLCYYLLISLPLLHGYLFKRYVSFVGGRATIKKRGICVVVVCFLLILFWYYDFKILGTGEVLPYLFFWD